MQLEEKSAHVAGSAGAESLHADYAEMDELINTWVTYDTGLYWGDEKVRAYFLEHGISPCSPKKSFILSRRNPGVPR